MFESIESGRHSSSRRSWRGRLPSPPGTGGGAKRRPHLLLASAAGQFAGVLAQLADASQTQTVGLSVGAFPAVTPARAKATQHPAKRPVR
jgi:hypothetical protein